MARKTREKFKTFENVFDQFTMNNLFKLGAYFDEETLSPVKIGKEANVFSAISKVEGRKRIAIKIHRLETSDFNQMWFYMRADPRFESIKKRKREVIFAWAQREFRNLMVAREARIRAPLPIAFLKNIIVMEFIGDPEPAPKIKDSIPSDPKRFMDKTIEYMRRLYKAGFVHGDLSKFNILIHKDEPILIDFSQTTPLKNPTSGELLHRDVVNVLDFFARQGVKTDVGKTLDKIKKK